MFIGYWLQKELLVHINFLCAQFSVMDKRKLDNNLYEYTCLIMCKNIFYSRRKKNTDSLNNIATRRERKLSHSKLAGLTKKYKNVYNFIINLNYTLIINNIAIRFRVCSPALHFINSSCYRTITGIGQIR